MRFTHYLIYLIVRPRPHSNMFGFLGADSILLSSLLQFPVVYLHALNCPYSKPYSTLCQVRLGGSSIHPVLTAGSNSREHFILLSHVCTHLARLTVSLSVRQITHISVTLFRKIVVLKVVRHHAGTLLALET